MVIREDMGVDRVTVMLPNGGHEQDVKAMLELYDHPEELTFPLEEISDKVSENDNNVRKSVRKAGYYVAIVQNNVQK